MAEVIILNFGTSLGKKSERLLIKEQGRVVEEIPFRDISSLTIATRGVSLSSDAILECIEHGVQINFLTSSGKPYAKVTSPQLSGTVATRREQILAYTDKRGAALAVAFIEGKLKNQANVLKYFAKYRRAADPELYRELEARLKRMEEICAELFTYVVPVEKIVTAKMAIGKEEHFTVVRLEERCAKKEENLESTCRIRCQRHRNFLLLWDRGQRFFRK